MIKDFLTTRAERLFYGQTLDEIFDPKRQELHNLAVYNSEVNRGIVHTQEYDERMAKVQQEFDQRPR